MYKEKIEYLLNEVIDALAAIDERERSEAAGESIEMAIMDLLKAKYFLHLV